MLIVWIKSLNQLIPERGVEKMKKALVCLLAAAVIGWAAPSVFAQVGVVGHSARGCYNCHVPHNAGKPGDANGGSWGVPLWSDVQSQNIVGKTFTMYTSKTFLAQGVVQSAGPDGSSKLCLSCHDGSYSHITNPLRNFGTDLTNMHPISIVYDSALAGRTKIAGELNDPSVALSGLGSTIANDILDQNNEMQCTTCHDVHATAITQTYAPTYPAGVTPFNPLLRFAWDPITARNDNKMCQICHNK
jgi:hypothetical protein